MPTVETWVSIPRCRQRNSTRYQRRPPVPRKKSPSKPAFEQNLKAELAAGRPQKQALGPECRERIEVFEATHAPKPRLGLPPGRGRARAAAHWTRASVHHVWRARARHRQRPLHHDVHVRRRTAVRVSPLLVSDRLVARGRLPLRAVEQPPVGGEGGDAGRRLGHRF